LRNSWPLYVGLAFGWLLLWWLNCDHPRAVSAGFDLNVPAYVWWLTQTKVLFTYLKLTFWPWPLAIHYEMPYLTTLGDAWLWLVPTVLLAIGIAVLSWRRYSVGFVGAWVFLILSPTLVVPIVTEVAAERRMYLPMAALVTLLVVGIYVLTQQTASRLDSASNRKSIPRWPAVFVAGFAFVVAMVFSLVSFHRLEAYHDEISLWQDNVLRQPDDSVSHNNLGMAFAQAGQLPEAMKEFEETIRLDPKHASAHNNLSYFLNRLGRTQEAIQQAELALRINPKSPDAHNNLGNALAEMGRKQEAIEQYRTALQLKPNYADAHNNLGFVLAGLGQLDDAIVEYEEALRLNPNYALARNNLGAILLNRGQFDQAVVNLQEAVRLQPDNIDARINLGIALARSGHDQAAVDILQDTLRFNLNNARIYNNLGLALSGTGRWQEAADHFQQAIKLQPDYCHAYVNLANTCAQLGRSAEAIAAAEKAMELARAQGQTGMSQQIESWLNVYRAKIKETAK
jgi:Flp pilus assembly protein TadD